MIEDKVAILNICNPINVSIEYDDYVDYRSGFSSYFNSGNIVKKINSWHSITAAFESEFFVYNKQNWAKIFNYKNVLILINRDLYKVKPVIKMLKSKGCKCVVAYHESLFEF